VLSAQREHLELLHSPQRALAVLVVEDLAPLVDLLVLLDNPLLAIIPLEQVHLVEGHLVPLRPRTAPGENLLLEASERQRKPVSHP
jgi:hypothetical protein